MALAVTVVASLLWAGPAGAETTLEVDAGYAGSFVPGQEVPVRVRISADRLVRGTLEVAVGSLENATPVAMAVEIPGGGQKEFLITARSGLNQSPDVVARLRQDDRLVASGQRAIRAAGDTELVGLLPGALKGRAVPGVAPLAVDAGTARFVAIGEAELGEAPDSLGPLSTLGADADELSRLSPGARTGVLRWIEAGGRLLVDSARGQTVPGLPDAWQPGPRGRAAAGLGEVVATDGAMAAGRWPGLVEPSGRGSNATRFNGQLPLASTLASDAGLRTPEIGWLVGFLAVYVIMVGPVLFFAVRRRGRPELAWVAVPLVAIVFSSGSYVVGRNLRNATQLVHASVLSSGPAGPSATSYIGVFSRSGETARVGFPVGWTSGPSADMGRAVTASLLTRTPEGPDAQLPLEAGQFGMVHASGPAPDGGGLDVTATVEPGGRVAGSVRNGTPFRLDEVAVFVGSVPSRLGQLGPGEQRTFAVVDAGQLGIDRGDGAEFRVWGSGMVGTPEAAVDFGLWHAALRSGGLNFMSPDAVVAAGWTREFVPDVRIGGRAARPEGRTVVVGRQQVAPPVQGVASVAGRRDIVRDGFSKSAPVPGPPASVVRFVLPDGADTSKLVVTNPFGPTELWQDGGWRTASCDDPACRVQGGFGPGGRACPPGVERCVAPPMPPRFGAPGWAVPPASVRDGVVYARVQGPASLDQGVAVTIGRTA
ncbi:MAG: hypothetical protein ACR2KK_16050 [Acidimicrobiales bacterium]